MFAIVEIAGKQYKVTQNDKIEVDRLQQDKGKITFDKVLLYAKDDKDVSIGNPYVNGASVEAEVLENIRGDKIRVFKMKPKKRYAKTIGHRTDLTVIEIKKINAGATKKSAAPKKEAEPKEEKTEE
ncbi:50S ribosomal protein L21 [Patescibacteria group bacterium]